MAHKATSLEGFLRIIRSIFEDKINHKFYHYLADVQAIYRGHADGSWKLLPSAFRDDIHTQNENLYLREFQRQLPNETVNLDYFDILVKAQHYGVPTRLLDFTLNPLVALYFACSSYSENDGMVVCIMNKEIFSQNELTVQILMHQIFRFRHTRLRDLNHVDLLCRSLDKDPDVYHEITREVVLDVLTREQPIFISPKLKNSRIQVQNGVFALFNRSLQNSYNSNEKYAYKMPTEYNTSAEEVLREVIIPKKNKEGILMQLDLIGINEAYLFPGLQTGLKTIVRRINQANYTCDEASDTK